MKRYKYLIILLILTPVVLFSQGKGVKPKFAPRGEKHRNTTDAKGKQGTWKFYTQNRDLFLEVNYENDLKNGPCIRYYTSTGGIREEINYFYGLKDGEYKSYFVSGATRSEGAFKKNRREEHWIFYHISTGEKSSEGDYANGKKRGEWQYYNRKGEMICKGDYVNDTKEGTWRYYNSENKEIKTEKYTRGALLNSDSQGGQASAAAGSGKTFNKSKILSIKRVSNKTSANASGKNPQPSAQIPLTKTVSKPMISFTPTAESIKKTEDSLKNSGKPVIKITKENETVKQDSIK